jgi:hypothetical protein
MDSNNTYEGKSFEPRKPIEPTKTLYRIVIKTLRYVLCKSSGCFASLVLITLGSMTTTQRYRTDLISHFIVRPGETPFTNMTWRSNLLRLTRSYVYTSTDSSPITWTLLITYEDVTIS